MCPDNVTCNTVQVPLPCDGGLFPANPYSPFAPPNVTCPSGTGLKSHPSPEDALCGLACPDASYTAEEWRRLVNLTQAGSALSLVFMVFLIFSYLIKADRRRFPATTHLHEFVATLLFSISFLIGGKHPEKNVWCFDSGTYATQSNNTACGVQGFFFIFFGLALAAWCCVIAFTMFFAVVLQQNSQEARKALRSLNKYFIIFGWGVPLMFAIAALAAKKIGYGPPLAWCFIQFEGAGYGSVFSSDYPLFYIPIGVFFVAILVMFCCTIVKIISVYKDRRNQSASAVFIKAQIRVLIFIFVIFAMCITIFEWRFQIEAKNRRENLASIGIKWTYCKIKLALDIHDETTTICPGAHNPSSNQQLSRN